MNSSRVAVGIIPRACLLGREEADRQDVEDEARPREATSAETLEMRSLAFSLALLLAAALHLSFGSAFS